MKKHLFYQRNGKCVDALYIEFAAITNQLCLMHSVVNLVSGHFPVLRQLSSININVLVTDTVFVCLSEDYLEC